MNARQVQMVVWLNEQVLYHDGLGERHIKDHEYKRFEIEECPETDLVFLTTEVGLIGDEGTMAEVLARTYRHYVIRKRGGTALLNAKLKREKRRLFTLVR